MLAIVVSRADSASVHIGEHLHDVADWREHTDTTRADADGGGTVYRSGGTEAADDGSGLVELREFDELHLDLDGVGEVFGRVDDRDERTAPDLLVFASRHAGETGELLTAHYTGNFGPAEYGGADGDLARTCPNAHSRVVDALAEHAPDGYEAGMECTHHGPSDVGVPSMFVEVGSGEPQWDDPDAARAVARAILALRGVDPDAPQENGRRRHLVGFGGGHYVPRFERIVRETDWSVGHLGADWALDAMGAPDENRAVVRQAFEESVATHAVVEGDRPDLKATVEDLGYRVVGETWVRETSGVSLALVDAVEDALGPVDAGVRFSERAANHEDADSAFSVVDLPGELLAEADGIDREATREAVERATLAFETTENGNRVAGRAAVVDESDRERLVDGLADVLATRYESVERADGAVVARETAFDPERARTLGIPDGPKFGRLAEGQSVEVDGETIDPSVVSVEREKRFPVEE